MDTKTEIFTVWPFTRISLLTSDLIHNFFLNAGGKGRVAFIVFSSTIILSPGGGSVENEKFT